MFTRMGLRGLHQVFVMGSRFSNDERAADRSGGVQHSPLGWFANLLSFLSRPWAAAVLAALVWGVFRTCFAVVPPLAHSDVWDYAQLARNLAQGEGFVSDFTYPLALHYDCEPPFSTLWRVPLYSSLIASAFFLTGTPSLLIPGLLSGAAFVLTAALTATLGTRLLGRNLAGALVLMVVFLPPFLSSALWGLTETVYACLLLMAVLALLRRTATADLLAGVCLGLSWLTRSNTLFLIPGILVWIFLSGENWKARLLQAARIFAALALVCTPWWFRNALAVGNPFVNVASYLPYTFTETWPAWTLLRTVVLPEAELPSAPVGQLLGRGLENLWTFGLVRRFLSANPLAIVLYYTGIYWAFRHRKSNPRIWAFAAFVGVSETVLMLALCFINPEIRIYSTLLPLVYLVALLPLRGLFQNGNWLKNLALTAVLVTASVYPVRFAMGLPRESWPTLTPDEVVELQERIPSGGIILSDTPDYLAWTLDRYAIALPTLKSLHRLVRMEPAISAIHVSPLPNPLMYDEGNGEQGWDDVLSGRLDLSPVGSLLHETESGHRFYEFRFANDG